MKKIFSIFEKDIKRKYGSGHICQMNGYLDRKWGPYSFISNDREVVPWRTRTLVHVIGYGFLREVVPGYGFSNETRKVEKCIKILLLSCT